MYQFAGWLWIGLCLSAAAIQGGAALDRGMEAFRRRDFAAAEQAFLQAVRQEPRNARAHKLLGMVYSAQEKYRLAEDPLRRACDLDPREENACYYLGRLLWTMSRFEEAEEVFRSALAQAANPGRTLNGLALTLEALGRIAEAEAAFKEAVRLGEPRASADYGLFLFKQGRSRESLEVLRKGDATEELERVSKVLAGTPSGRARAAALPVHFEAQTLDMLVRNGATGNKHLVETMIAGIAVLDYDSDGWPDIYVANGGELPGLAKTGAGFHNRLFRNNGNGTFSDVTDRAGVAGHSYSMGVAAADYDNDGWTDLFVTGVKGNTLYRNNRDGTFADVSAKAGLAGDGQWAVAAAWLDYDNDGLLDLFVVRYVRWDPALEPLCGSQRPGMRGYCHPRHYPSLPNSLYRNRGDGTFEDVSRESGIAAHPGKGMGVALGDFDLDGKIDIFICNDTVPNFLFRNEGNGRFQEVGLAAGVAYNADGRALSSMGTSVGDCDNDGLEDIFVTALTNETFPLFRNLGKGLFVDISITSRIAGASLPWSGWSTGMYDFNNDGFKDLFVANGNVLDNAEALSSRTSRQANLVFVNKGDGTFRAEPVSDPALHRGSAFGDFDRDGRIDVAVTRLNEQPVVLRNAVSPPGHWIALRLAGTRSNRDGLGAWIRMASASGEQWNRAVTSVGYGCSSDKVVHFGLGKDSRADLIEVRWPSGITQRFEKVQADRYITIEEPRQP